MSMRYRDYLIDLENEKREEQSVKCDYCKKYYLNTDIIRHRQTKKCQKNKLETEKWKNLIVNNNE